MSDGRAFRTLPPWTSRDCRRGRASIVATRVPYDGAPHPGRASERGSTRGAVRRGRGGLRTTGRAFGPRLVRAGFASIRQRTRPMHVTHASVEAYLDYRLAFGTAGFDRAVLDR